MSNKDINSEFLTRGCHCAPNIQERCLNVYKHSCNKMDATNWLKNVDKSGSSSFTEFVEVKFKNSRKEIFRTNPDMDLKEGDIVAVEANPGHDIGIVTLIGQTVRLQMRSKKIKPDSEEIKKVYRKAKTSDIEKWINSVGEEQLTMHKSREMASSLNLDMKISDVEYQGDNTKAIFYYTANERVDFRELIKVLADAFNVRIEMKQIGMRQEASRLGGIGSCGRELCCATWISNFKSVSTSAARVQQLSLNPQKLAGQCSKLKCCLNYENEAYLDALEGFPDTSIELKTKRGIAFHQKTDILRKVLWYTIKNSEDSFIMITAQRANEIIEMNKKGIIPENLIDNKAVAEQKPIADFASPTDIENDSLTRFDKAKPNKRRKNKRKKNKKNIQNNKPNTE